MSGPAGASEGASATGARNQRRAWWWLGVLACAALGLVLRTWNLDYDQRQHLHPDERHWSLTSAQLAAEEAPPRHGTVAGPLLDWLDGQRSPANPYRGTDTFVYGPATLALARGTSGWLHDGAATGSQPAAAVVEGLDAAGIPLLDADGEPRFDDGYQVDLVGRLLGALADTAMIVVVACIGRRVAGGLAGLLAAGFAACSVLAIQHAHFFGSEPWLGLASALLVLALLRMDRGPDPGRSARSGFVVGIAAGAVLAVKASGAGLVLVPFAGALWLVGSHRRWADLARLAAMTVGAFAAFRVLCPPAFDGLGLLPNGQFFDDLRSVGDPAVATLPPAVQWANRVPGWDALRWLALFTVGPGAAVAAVVGTTSLLRRRWELGRWSASVMVAGWSVPLVFVLRQQVTTGRYFVPALPALLACAGVGLARTIDVARRSASASGMLAGGAAAAMGGLAVLWAVAFVAGVHGHPHTRVQASEWIAANVEPGSVLTVQSWDDGLPLPVEGVDPLAFETEQLDVFGGDRLDTVRQLADQLGRVDYVVESSPRVWGAVRRIPARHPSGTRFFEALDDGSLGFERVATFTSPPRVGWWVIDDRSAEEAFSVYDHPEVRIWQRVRDVPASERLAQLDPVAAANALPVRPADAHANGALLLDDERAENQRAGTYVGDFDVGGSPAVHVIGWLVVIELVGLAAFAAFAPSMVRLPDAGYGMAKLLGLVVVGFATFAAVTWLGLASTRPLVLAVVGLWLAVGAWRGWANRLLLRDLWQQRRQALLWAEAVVLLAFAVVLLLRAANPDLWHLYRGGEKPFELEMLTSVLRTRTLPPYDPWYAGGTLNYYYGGYLLLAVPAKVLRTEPTLVLNLGLATFAALGAGAAWSAGSAIAGAWPRRWWVGPEGAARARAARRGGAFAVLAVLVVPSASIVPHVVRRTFGDERGALDWWSLSRTVPRSPIVTEYPSWSLLFGDLHPHVMDLPVLVALVAVAVVWGQNLLAGDGGGRVLVPALLAGLVVGMARATNTWDLPLAAVVAAAPVVVALLARVPWRRCAWSAAAGAAVAIGGWWPYTWRTEVSDAGFELEDLRTPMASATAHFGLLAAASLLASMVVLARTPALRRATVRSCAAVAVALGALSLVAPDRAVLGAALALALAAGAAGWSVRSSSGPPGPTWVAFAALAVGWSLVGAIEVVSVVNDFDRQNTVFKGWFQAWQLLALGAAAAIAALALPASADGERLRDRPPWVRAGAIGARGVVAVAVLATVAFAQLAVPARLDDRTSTGGLSLDGTAYLDELAIDVGPSEAELSSPSDARRPLVPGDDRPLIDWLRRNVEGIVPVAEAPGEGYTWTGRIAAHTGLPTVLGWPYHQSQQRRSYADAIASRRADLEALYISADPELMTSTLQRHRIAYVVFGTLEQQLATPESAAALRDLPCLDVVFEDDGRFVAEVDQRCLADQPGGLPVRAARSGPDG